MLLLEDNLEKTFKMIDKEIFFENLYIDDCLGYCEIEDMLDIPREAYIRSGASKIVIINDNCDMVLKFPVVGRAYYYTEDDEECEYSDEPAYEDYVNSSAEREYDYCLRETDLYEKAEEEGFEEFFPFTKFYKFTKDGVPTYIQEKVTEFYGASDEARTPSEKASSFVKEKKWDINHTWLSCCVDYYGEKRTEEFIDWLYQPENYDYRSDLHNGNLGLKKNGAPCILDFAGFRD